MFTRFTHTGVHWDDGRELEADAVIWCTGFRPDLGHLRALNLATDGTVPATAEKPPTQSADRAGMFFLGYGDWAGSASATLIGVGAPTRATVTAATEHITGTLRGQEQLGHHGLQFRTLPAGTLTPRTPPAVRVGS